jgi:hypothetical protein
MMLVHQATTWAVMTYEDINGVFLTRCLRNDVWEDPVKTGSAEAATIEHMASIASLSNGEEISCYSF